MKEELKKSASQPPQAQASPPSSTAKRRDNSLEEVSYEPPSGRDIPVEVQAALDMLYEDATMTTETRLVVRNDICFHAVHHDATATGGCCNRAASKRCKAPH